MYIYTSTSKVKKIDEGFETHLRIPLEVSTVSRHLQLTNQIVQIYVCCITFLHVFVFVWTGSLCSGTVRSKSFNLQRLSRETSPSSNMATPFHAMDFSLV